MSSAVGCGATSSENPYAAPCAADFAITAVVGTGGIIIEPVSSLDSSFEFATLDLTTQTSSIDVGQVDVVNSQAKTSGVSLKLTTNAQATVSGGGVATAHTSSDPAAKTDDYDEAGVPAQVSETIVTPSAKNSVQVTSSAADTATARSTVSALHEHPCVYGTDQQLDGRPCSTTNALQQNKLTASINYPDEGVDLSPVVRVAAETSPSSAFTDRTVAASGSCSLEGCIRGRARRAITDLQLGLLPALHGSADWVGLVRVENVVAAAEVEAGEDAAPPTVTSSGAVSYWNGSGYTTVSLADGPHTFTTSHTVTGVYRIDMDGSFTAGGSAIEDPAAVAEPDRCNNSRCRRTSATASAQVLNGNLTYKVSQLDGTPVADLRISVNLGTVRSAAGYERPLHAF
jgi:hypothetical protein